jgi:hypothetical protein
MSKNGITYRRQFKEKVQKASEPPKNSKIPIFPINLIPKKYK